MCIWIIGTTLILGSRRSASPILRHIHCVVVLINIFHPLFSCRHHHHNHKLIARTVDSLCPNDNATLNILLLLIRPSLFAPPFSTSGSGLKVVAGILLVTHPPDYIARCGVVRIKSTHSKHQAVSSSIVVPFIVECIYVAADNKSVGRSQQQENVEEMRLNCYSLREWVG